MIRDICLIDPLMHLGCYYGKGIRVVFKDCHQIFPAERAPASALTYICSYDQRTSKKVQRWTIT